MAKLTPVRSSMLPVMVKDAAMRREQDYNVIIGCFCLDLRSRAATSLLRCGLVGVARRSERCVR